MRVVDKGGGVVHVRTILLAATKGVLSTFERDILKFGELVVLPHEHKLYS